MFAREAMARSRPGPPGVNARREMYQVICREVDSFMERVDAYGGDLIRRHDLRAMPFRVEPFVNGIHNGYEVVFKFRAPIREYCECTHRRCPEPQHMFYSKTVKYTVTSQHLLDHFIASLPLDEAWVKAAMDREVNTP